MDESPADKAKSWLTAKLFGAGVVALMTGLVFSLPAPAQQKAPDPAPDKVVPRPRTLAGGETARKQVDELLRMGRGGIVDKDLVFACTHALEAAAWGGVEGAVSYHALSEMLNREELVRCKTEARDDLAGNGDVVRPRMLQSPRTLP